MKKLLAVTVFSGLLTLLRMACSFIVGKMVAIYTGPGGMAMLGQIQGLQAALGGIVSAPVGNAVVRFTAVHHMEGNDACAPWWRASLRWMLLLLAVLVPVACLAAPYLSTQLFDDKKYAWLIALCALVLPLNGLNTLLGSVINGQQHYKKFIGYGLLSVTVSTVLMLTLIMGRGLKGALLAATLSTSVAAMVMLYACKNQSWLHFKYWWGKTEKKHMAEIAGYMGMAATSALCLPLALIMTRKLLTAHLGWDIAGQWQAVYKISELYLGVITMALSTYYLPRLATLQGSNAIKAEIGVTAKIVLPIISLIALIIYLARDLVIGLLFTQQFSAARDLFSLQLIGDVIKIASWLYAYPMLSHGATRWYISTEILFSASFVGLVALFLPRYGVQGANLAYLINYIVYFLVVYCNINRFTNINIKQHN